MIQPGKNLTHGRNFRAPGQRRTVDHHNRQAKLAGRSNLSITALAARIFGHHQINLVVFQQFAVGFLAERTARDDQFVVRQVRSRSFGLHHPQKVAVLRNAFEQMNICSSNGEKDAFRFSINKLNGVIHVACGYPMIPGLRLPRRPGQRDQRNTGSLARSNRVVAHLRRERMGGVDDMRNTALFQKSSQAVHAAKTANPGFDRLGIGTRNAACIGKYSVDPAFCHTSRQKARLGRTAENEEGRAHV